MVKTIGSSDGSKAKFFVGQDVEYSAAEPSESGGILDPQFATGRRIRLL